MMLDYTKEIKKNIKYNMYICNRSNISTIERMEKYEYTVIK